MINKKIIGVDLGGTNLRVGRIKNGSIEDSINESINPNGSKKKVLEQISKAIDKVYKKDIKGIGFGVPAIVDMEKGIAYEASNIPSWKKVYIKRYFEKRYNVPVKVNNDSNCFTLGEALFGEGKKYKNLVGITLGTGVGAGIVFNGKLYCGHNCGAGDFGEVVYKEGIFEDYCSGKFFKKQYRMNGIDVYEKARKGDRKAISIFNEYGRHLGKLLDMVIKSVDPECIVIGGAISSSYKYFQESMLTSLKKLSYQRSFSRIKIKRSRLENAALFGAAALLKK